MDRYIFQYNAFPSDSLPVEMTKKYHFKRSKHQALVNITVIDKQSTIQFKGVKAKIEGVIQNLLAQQKKLMFKEIYEDNAYYYIAQVGIEHNEVVHLKIKSKPSTSDKSYSFKFVKQFATK